MRKYPYIWCEVHCCNCGGIVGHVFTGLRTINKLQKETADWKSEDGLNLCPNCAEELGDDPFKKLF